MWHLDSTCCVHNNIQSNTSAIKNVQRSVLFCIFFSANAQQQTMWASTANKAAKNIFKSSQDLSSDQYTFDNVGQDSISSICWRDNEYIFSCDWQGIIHVNALSQNGTKSVQQFQCPLLSICSAGQHVVVGGLDNSVTHVDALSGAITWQGFVR